MDRMTMLNDLNEYADKHPLPAVGFGNVLSEEQLDALGKHMLAVAERAYKAGYDRARFGWTDSRYELESTKLEALYDEKSVEFAKSKTMSPPIDNLMYDENKQVDISELIPYIENMPMDTEELNRVIAGSIVRAKETSGTVLISLAGDYDLLVSDNRVHLIDSVRSFVPSKVLEVK